MILVGVVAWPLLMAALLLALWQKQTIRKIVALSGSIIHVILAGTLFAQVQDGTIIQESLSNWAPPFGIQFSADILGATLALVSCVIGLCTVIYSYQGVDSERKQYGFYPLFFVLMTGLCGAFLTNDIFNLFVWFECILLSSFVLLSLGGEKPQIRGALNYVFPNLFSSMVFLAAIGLLYGATGTLNMDDMGVRIAAMGDNPILPVIATLFIIAFSVKGALFPFYSWLPTSYHTPPFVITAFFGGLLTKVGVYSVIRFFTKIYPLPEGILTQFFVGISVFTMLAGIFGAIVQKDVRRVLAFHIISQIGYMTVGLALRDQYAMGASVFYMVHHILVITNLLFLAGILQWHMNTNVRADMGSGLKRYPLLAATMFVPMMALAGLPPFSGFWPKFALIQAASAHENWFLVIGMLFTGFLTLYSMAKIWSEVFLKEPPTQADGTPGIIFNDEKPPSKYGPAVLLCIITLLIGIAPAWLSSLADRSAKQLTPNWKTAVPTELIEGGTR